MRQVLYRKSLYLLSLVASLLILPAAARADTIGIDDFVLTGEGQVVTFSSPATVNGRGSYGAGGSDGGFIDTPTNFQINGQPTSVSSMQVFSRNFPSFNENGGFIIYTSARTFEIVGTVLYSGSSNDATFLTGTFHLVDYQPYNGVAASPFVLTITPEAAPIPEPPTLLLLLTAACGLGAFACKRGTMRGAGST